MWPPTVRDAAAGHLQALLESHRNLRHMQEGAAALLHSQVCLPGPAAPEARFGRAAALQLAPGWLCSPVLCADSHLLLATWRIG
jgi:hypothetical protein